MRAAQRIRYFGLAMPFKENVIDKLLLLSFNDFFWTYFNFFFEVLFFYFVDVILLLAQ